MIMLSKFYPISPSFKISLLKEIILNLVTSFSSFLVLQDMQRADQPAIDHHDGHALPPQKAKRSKDCPSVSKFRILATEKLERFSHYVARQMGFADRRECPHLCKLGCEDNIYSFFADEVDADSLYIKLVEELERCILSSFAFHWGQAHHMINQVLGADSEPKKKLRHIIMAATREQRFDRVTKNLKVARVFNTLVEEMKAIGIVPFDDSQCTDVMAPVDHKDRSPVLLLMGGGMGSWEEYCDLGHSQREQQGTQW